MCLNQENSHCFANSKPSYCSQVEFDRAKHAAGLLQIHQDYLSVSHY